MNRKMPLKIPDTILYYTTLYYTILYFSLVRYGERIDHAESEITARLRDRLGAAKTATEM